MPSISRIQFSSFTSDVISVSHVSSFLLSMLVFALVYKGWTDGPQYIKIFILE